MIDFRQYINTRSTEFVDEHPAQRLVLYEHGAHVVAVFFLRGNCRSILVLERLFLEGMESQAATQSLHRVLRFRLMERINRLGWA